MSTMYIPVTYSSKYCRYTYTATVRHLGSDFCQTCTLVGSTAGLPLVRRMKSWRLGSSFNLSLNPRPACFARPVMCANLQIPKLERLPLKFRYLRTPDWGEELSLKILEVNVGHWPGPRASMTVEKPTVETIENCPWVKLLLGICAPFRSLPGPRAGLRCQHSFRWCEQLEMMEDGIEELLTLLPD
jgi:hypothetical protein